MVAVNPGSLESHRSWEAQFGFGFPICTDEGSKVAAAYGAQKPEGGIQRTVFVINQQGRITWARQGMPSTQETLDALDQLKADDPDSTRLSSS